MHKNVVKIGLVLVPWEACLPLSLGTRVTITELCMFVFIYSIWFKRE